MSSTKPAAILADVKYAIRNKYAWPGGYPLYVLMADGEALSVEAARQEWRQIARDTIRKDYRSEWCAYAADINWEDASMYCAHTGKRIESAYAEE